LLANFASSTDERAAYTSDFEDFEAYVTIRKQSDILAAGPASAGSPFEREDAGADSQRCVIAASNESHVIIWLTQTCMLV